jgi:photosystem II stability/assembly factor-like uncharacterized protein
MMENLATRYARLQDEMDRLSAGDVIGAAAGAVLAELPTGRITLISTSDQGAGLAAICASRHADATWHKVNLIGPVPVATAGDVVVVEPVDPGAGWRQAVERAYPGARVIVAAALPGNMLVAA